MKVEVCVRSNSVLIRVDPSATVLALRSDA